jgi:hypothetical protein
VVERHVANVNVMSSNLIARLKEKARHQKVMSLFYGTCNTRKPNTLPRQALRRVINAEAYQDSGIASDVDLLFGEDQVRRSEFARVAARFGHLGLFRQAMLGQVGLGVENIASFTSVDNQTALTQDSKMTGDSGLRKLEPVAQGCHVHLAFGKHHDNSHPDIVSKRMENSGQLFKFVYS